MSQTVLVTGGCGYIGSHVLVELLTKGYTTIVVDNLVNSSRISLKRVTSITGKDINFIEEDICNYQAMDQIFATYKPYALIHLAGLKAVAESVRKPQIYYHNNVSGTINLINAALKYNCHKFVFSSSATVYDHRENMPLVESAKTAPSNPYGHTKLINEQILTDTAKHKPQFKVAILRYFNPIGAHPSGTIGENPNDIPNNLMPYITQVAVGKLDKVHIFGNDYPTPDGTGVRDYIHISDLALGHLKALQALDNNNLFTVNLGTGKGYSVLEVINAAAIAANKKIPYVFTSRRAGDVATCYSDPSAAKQLLNWEAKLSLEQMCHDAWQWQKNNPQGYQI